MGTWHALYYPIKAGSEEKVKQLFRESGRPQFAVHDPRGNEVGRLLGTMVFVGTRVAVRVIEVEGSLPLVAAHMSRQPEVKAFEDRLEEHLSEPRDMTSPQGAREFFRRAGLECVLARRHDEPLEPVKSVEAG